MTPLVPVRIRGVDYPSITAAASAFGVHKSTVCRALDNGTIDHVGLGPRAANRVAVKVDGVEYPSILDAMKALGRSNGWVRNRMRQVRRRA